MSKRSDFTVDIYGESWDVCFIPKVMMDGVETEGMYDKDKKTLWIGSTLTKEVGDVAILHEMFHAYIDRMGISDAELSPDLEEILANQYPKMLWENFEIKIP